MAQALLSGEQEYVHEPSEETKDLLRRLERAEREAEHIREAAARSIGEMRDALQPLYRAMKLLFGEMGEIAGPGAGPVAAPQFDPVAAPQFDPKWEAWKQKLGPSTAPARIIDTLLKHGPLNRNQLRQASEMGWSTLDAATGRLKNLSLIEKSGDRWTLKG